MDRRRTFLVELAVAAWTLLLVLLGKLVDIVLQFRILQALRGLLALCSQKLLMAQCVFDVHQFLGTHDPSPPKTACPEQKGFMRDYQSFSTVTFRK